MLLLVAFAAGVDGLLEQEAVAVDLEQCVDDEGLELGGRYVDTAALVGAVARELASGTQITTRA